MYKMVNIYDVRNILHCNSKVSRIVNGLPVGGLEKLAYFLLNRAGEHVLAFDSQVESTSDSYSGVNDDYKGTRNQCPHSIRVMESMLISMADTFGFTVFVAEPGKEADDIIGTLVSDYHNKMPKAMITVISDDIDLVGSVMNPYITKMSPTGKTPRVNTESLETMYGYMPLNFMAVYTALHGKKSDNIKPMKDVPPGFISAFYSDLNHIAQEKPVVKTLLPMASMYSKMKMLLALSNYIKTLPEEFVTEFKRRLELTCLHTVPNVSIPKHQLVRPEKVGGILSAINSNTRVVCDLEVEGRIRLALGLDAQSSLAGDDLLDDIDDLDVAVLMRSNFFGKEEDKQ